MNYQELMKYKSEKSPRKIVELVTKFCRDNGLVPHGDSYVITEIVLAIYAANCCHDLNRALSNRNQNL
jgi:hypothetical protein